MIHHRDEILLTSSMHTFSNGPSLMQSCTKVPRTCITIYTCMYKLWYCTLCHFAMLQNVFSSCTVHSTYTRYIFVSWRSAQALTNNPLPIQIGREYFIELVKHKFQGGWFIQFEIQYQLRIKRPKAKCIKTLGDRSFARVG